MSDDDDMGYGYAPNGTAPESAPVAIGCVCPLMGKPCPGPRECAPAVMYAEDANRNLDPTMYQQLAPVCPITSLVESSRVVHLALIPLLLGEQETKGQQMTEEEQRRAAIRAAKPDQMDL